jgi:hypothetical protein
MNNVTNKRLRGNGIKLFTTVINAVVLYKLQLSFLPAIYTLVQGKEPARLSQGRLQPLFANIRLGWKRLELTNTLGYKIAEVTIGLQLFVPQPLTGVYVTKPF